MIKIEIPYPDADFFDAAVDAEQWHDVNEDTLIPYWEVWPQIARKYLEELQQHLKVTLIFDRFQPTQDEGLEDDRLFAQISKLDMQRLLKNTNLQVMQEVYAERFSPCEGFFPFSKYRSFPITPFWEWADVQLYCVIEAYLRQHPFNARQHMDNWICDLIGGYV